MFCTSNEQETCEVEKRGCEGCFYNKEVPTPDNPISIELERRSPQSEAKYWNEKYIDTLLKLFKEKETSHHIQSQLDYANAKLIEEKEKNKKLEEEKASYVKGYTIASDEYVETTIKKIKQKDFYEKVIDMMAEEIWRCNAIDCDFKHFKDNICKDEQDTGNKQICKECIKQYYFKKVKKE